MRSGQHPGKLGACQEAGIDKVHLTKSVQRLCIPVQPVALKNGLAAPGQAQKGQIVINLFSEFRAAPCVVDIVNSKLVATANTRGNQR